MKVETVKTESISLDPANVRLHPEAQIEKLNTSLKRFGQVKPIVIDGAGVCWAGNGTLIAIKALGWPEVQIVRTNLKGSEATAFSIG